MNDPSPPPIALPRPSRVGGCFAFPFVAFWCAITFTATTFVSIPLSLQLWAMVTFAETTGTLEHAAFNVNGNDDGGVSYSFDVRFTYTVDGQAFVGDRYRFGPVGPNMNPRDPLKPGAAVPVYHSRFDPSVAILDWRLQGEDLFLPWFLVPFNVIAIGGLIFVFRRPRSPFDPTDRRTIAPTESGWQFRPAGRDWWLYFGGTLLGITFVGTFIIGFGFGFGPPLWVMLLAWPTAIFTAMKVASRFQCQFALEVNFHENSLMLGELTLPLAEVSGFTVYEIETTDSDGDRITTYRVLLRQGKAPPTICVYSFSEKLTADVVANWLTHAIRTDSRSPL